MQLPTEQMPIRQITVPEEPEEKQAFESELFPDVGPIDEEEYRVMLLRHKGYYPDMPVHREHAFPFPWDYPPGSDSEEDENEGLNAEAYQEKRVQSRTEIRRCVPSERGRRQGDGYHTPTFVTRTTVVDQKVTTWQSRDHGEPLLPDSETKVHVATQVPSKDPGWPTVSILRSWDGSGHAADSKER
jgi:hypothetical protein